MASEQADAPIKTSDVEWKKAVQKLLLGPSGDGRARVYTAEEMQAVQKMRESFPDQAAVPDKREC
jgi:hypothetical protein